MIMDYKLERVDEYRVLIPQGAGMRVPGMIYASEKTLPKVSEDRSPEQVVNMAQLPGILRYSLAMPDIHWGYGAPIGGVAAFDLKEGIVAPGIVGYDINCGVRLLRTNLRREAFAGKEKELMDTLYRNIPCGVGSSGQVKLSRPKVDDVLKNGAVWAVKNGYGSEADLLVLEEAGRYRLADPDKVSNFACERGSDQLGTLGSGNHFLEIQEVKEIFDREIAEAFHLFVGQVTVMIHTGSRGLGYQVAEDYLVSFGKNTRKYGFFLPDQHLVCAPIGSPEGKSYLGAMAAAANFAWANRQIIAFRTAETLKRVLGMSESEIGLATVYDVAHNIAKVEEHLFDGKKVEVLVHRKGATRAFPTNAPGIPDVYKKVGQPVLLPGTMGTSSYVLVGTERALSETWGSTSHGAGRSLSRHEAVRRMKGRSAATELADLGVLARAPSFSGLAEEMPEAYKDVEEVVKIVEGSGLSRRVSRMIPFAVIKG